MVNVLSSRLLVVSSGLASIHPLLNYSNIELLSPLLLGVVAVVRMSALPSVADSLASPTASIHSLERYHKG